MIRGTRHLFERIVDWQNLYEAYRHAARGKRFRGEVLRFADNLEENLVGIQNELLHGSYEVGRYLEFFIHDPKKRLIMALPFRDRVVQWAAYQVLEPIFERRMIPDSYACRVGKGTHAAADRVQYWMRYLDRRGRPYALKLDVAKYFYRVDHEVLMGILRRQLACRRTLALLELFVRSQDTRFGITLGDHDFGLERLEGIGMPIGNLTSQLFANLYLDQLDHYAKERLRIRHYIRYMDDVLVLSLDKRQLRGWKDALSEYLRDELRLDVNDKTSIHPIADGVEFVGYRLWPTHRKVRKSTVRKMKRRLLGLQRAYERGLVSWDAVNASVQSYFGLLKHADAHGLSRWLSTTLVFRRGSACS